MTEEPKPIKTERINNPDGTYTVKKLYEENDKKILSSIINYDNFDRELNGTVFSDVEYIKELYSYVYKYFDDGSYEQKVKSYDKELGWIDTGHEYYEKYHSCIINSNINSIKYFANNNFTKIVVDELYNYNKDNSYEVKQKIYRYTDNDNIDYDYSYSRINYYNNNRIFYSCKYFSDIDSKEHSYTYRKEFLNDSTEIHYYVYETQNHLYGALHFSRKIYYYKDLKEKEELFSDKNFTNLIATINTTHINDAENIIQVKGIGEFETHDIIYKSFTQDYNKSSCKSKYFKNKDFSDLLFSEFTNEITDKKLAVVKTIYGQACNKSYLSQIDYYSFDNNTKKTEYFEDNNFQKLYIND